MGLAKALSPLLHRDFRLLWIGGTLSLIGTQMQRVALAWHVYQLAHDPLAQGTIGLARALPMIGVALAGGVVADVVDRRRLILGTQALLALVSLALSWLTATGRASVPLLYLATGIAGAVLAIDNPAQQALVPNLVPIDVLPRALSLRTISWQVGSILGPTLGGLALVWIGPEGVYAIDAISYGAILAGVLLIRYKPTHAPAVRPNLAAALEGIRFLRRSPILWSTMLLDFLATFFVESSLLFPIFADKVLGVGEEGLGKLFAAPSVGAVIAAFAMLWLEPPRRQGLTIIISVGIYGLAATLFGFSETLPWACFWLAVSGAADAVSMVVRNTLRQEITPDELRGRMTSVGLIFFAGGPMLGEFEAGAVARVFGVQAAFISGGAASVALAAAFAWVAPWLRRYTRAEPVALAETKP